MMVEDFSESGHEVREKRTQTYPSAWESLTLRNIVAEISLAQWTTAHCYNSTDMEIYWLDRLENFFLSVAYSDEIPNTADVSATRLKGNNMFKVVDAYGYEFVYGEFLSEREAKIYILENGLENVCCIQVS